MYIVNGICYAGELVPSITVTDAKPLDGGVVLVDIAPEYIYNESYPYSTGEL